MYHPACIRYLAMVDVWVDAGLKMSRFNQLGIPEMTDFVAQQEKDLWEGRPTHLELTYQSQAAEVDSAIPAFDMTTLSMTDPPPADTEVIFGVGAGKRLRSTVRELIVSQRPPCKKSN